MNSYECRIDQFSLMTSLLNVLNEKNTETSSYVLARYFLERFDRLEQLNIYDVAEECFVSRSGIQRFCKSIGFDTFSNMKFISAMERELSQTTYIAYGRLEDFRENSRQAMNKMMEELEMRADQEDLPGFAQMIHDSQNVVILTAECSSMAPRDLQQELLAAGKLIYLVTDSHPNFDLIQSLGSNDLLVVCSVTGNYAYAINESIAQIESPHKILVTLNRDSFFIKNYHRIIYLSDEGNDRQRSVYTKYGMGYFLDLLYNTYLRQYSQQQ